MTKKDTGNDKNISEKIVAEEDLQVNTGDTSDEVEDLKKKITQLEKKLADQEEITKRAQSDYFRLKMEWDQYVTRTEAMKANLKVDSLISTAQKLLPAVSQLEQTVLSMPTEFTDSSWAQGVKLVYTKITSQLDSLKIKKIEPELGTEPDLTLHIPISSQPVEDKKQQGKIVQGIETGFLYKDNENEKVIIPAKVIVGA